MNARALESAIGKECRCTAGKKLRRAIPERKKGNMRFTPQYPMHWLINSIAASAVHIWLRNCNATTYRKKQMKRLLRNQNHAVNPVISGMPLHPCIIHLIARRSTLMDMAGSRSSNPFLKRNRNGGCLCAFTAKKPAMLINNGIWNADMNLKR